MISWFGQRLLLVPQLLDLMHGWLTESPSHTRLQILKRSLISCGRSGVTAITLSFVKSRWILSWWSLMLYLKALSSRFFNPRSVSAQTAFQAEIYALISALQRIIQKGLSLQHLEIESDCLQLVEIIRSNQRPPWKEQHLFATAKISQTGKQRDSPYRYTSRHSCCRNLSVVMQAS